MCLMTSRVPEAIPETFKKINTGLDLDNGCSVVKLRQTFKADEDRQPAVSSLSLMSISAYSLRRRDF